VEQGEENVPFLQIGLLVIGGDRERAEHVISMIEVALLMMPVEREQVRVATVSLGIIKIEGEQNGILQ